MKREDGRELFFGMAYWKKRWVSVPDADVSGFSFGIAIGLRFGERD